MQNMCVLFESEVTAPGYFCLRFNTQSSFFPIFFKGRTGHSGEIYAIDNHGRFITPARFAPNELDNVTPELQQQATRIGTEVRNPRGALTKMADFFINLETGLIEVG